MKEKIIKILESQFSVVEYEDPDTGFTESTTIDVLTTDEFPDIVDKLEILVNQEVERRIAERMPTKGESHKKIFELCAMPDNLGKGLRGVISAPMKYEIFDEWIRSRLTNPGEQKTKGGGE